MRPTFSEQRPSAAAEPVLPAPAKKTARRQSLRPVDLGILNGHLGYFIRRAQVWVFQDFIRTLARADIRPAQYSVLVVVEANPGLSQAEVANTLGIERARLVRLLDQLEQRGFIRRLAMANDRRSHALQLTREGQKALQRIKALAAQHETRLMEKLGAARHKLMLDMLRDFDR